MGMLDVIVRFALELGALTDSSTYTSKSIEPWSGSLNQLLAHHALVIARNLHGPPSKGA
jgi:hypothetical protein